MVLPAVLAIGGAALRVAGPWLGRTALPWLGRQAMRAAGPLATRFGPRITGWLGQRAWGRALMSFVGKVGPKLGGAFALIGGVIGVAGKVMGLMGKATSAVAPSAMSVAGDIAGAGAAGLQSGGGLFSLAGQFEAAVAGGGAAQSGMGTTVADGLRKHKGQFGLAA